MGDIKNREKLAVATWWTKIQKGFIQNASSQTIGSSQVQLHNECQLKVRFTLQYGVGDEARHHFEFEEANFFARLQVA